MVHRGPDDEGIHIDDGIGLGMRRLSIIDIENGHQPICNEDGSIWVVSNGEIYNYRSLRRMLERRGHRFRTNSDIEVIVHLYEEIGTDCVQQLRGMFSLAVWDSRKQRLFIARDRIGIKPLYYSEVGGRLVFASELKSLLQLSEIERRLSRSSVNYLFTFMTTPPNMSVIEGVWKLEPGHAMVVSRDQLPRIHRYWNIEFEPNEDHTEDYYVDGIRSKLKETIELHLASDVPLGVFLSGGVDSGAVAASMAKLIREPINTFSIGFRDPRYDESSQAEALAKSLGAKHRKLILESDVMDELDSIIWHLDEPFGDSSAIPTYMVSKLASEYVSVVLSGDGGDELFAGYDKYRVEKRERRIDAIPEVFRKPLGKMAEMMREGMKGRRFLYQMSLSGSLRYLNAGTPFRRENGRYVLTQHMREMTRGDDPWEEAIECLESGGKHWLSRLQSFDIQRYLPLDILAKVDRMSMAHSLEVRPPLLDHELVEFVARIPAEMHMSEGVSKSILKKALNGLLPDDVLRRPKRGFAIPLADWFRNDLSGFVRDLLLSDSSRHRGIVNTDYVEQLIRMHKQGRAQDDQLWLLISFEQWCRQFLDEGPRIQRDYMNDAKRAQISIASS
jgi:asparagine synthase (glutamine-hydrolysing)